MLLNRIKPSWYMSGWMMAWAIVSTLMAVVQDYKGMLACRFVLGITEAPFYPGGVYLISMFYTRKESATRMSIFYTGNLLASSFSGLIAAGVFAGMEGKSGLEGWRWLFIIQGLITGMLLEALCWNFADMFGSWRRCTGLLHAAQCTSPDPMAHTRGARTGSQPHCVRHHGEEGQAERLERTARGMHRLPHVGLCTHAECKSIGENAFWTATD